MTGGKREGNHSLCEGTDGLFGRPVSLTVYFPNVMDSSCNSCCGHPEG